MTVSVKYSFIVATQAPEFLEKSYQVNHLGPQYLNELLMPLLELKSGRIVMVGSKQANNYGNLVLNSFKKCECITSCNLQLGM